MIIKISSNGKGAWNLVARERDDDMAPLVYTANGRNRVQIEFLLRGILADQESFSPVIERKDQA
ncbi:hypothetical protein OWR29_25475 [Actinoplanes sp. Pm04-4]|uniref:Transposase n=1 Tax=Paractinoplanes pyxinae TaxID=2997416 RepID=A0ABT4B4E6_9ACTN|nr:hypothetical protein [Actinoplanes pyxinae]MCY1141363.1 hypothetical protein [Actinoplanes pyxinae]